MNKLQELSVTLDKNVKVSLYYSKYSFKNDSLVNKEIIYQGTIGNCDKKLLDGTKISKSHKYIRIWFNK